MRVVCPRAVFLFQSGGVSRALVWVFVLVGFGSPCAAEVQVLQKEVDLTTCVTTCETMTNFLTIT